ncbi:MAG: hypothetical protein CISAcid_16100 [uncultured Acidilobus sp. CIS]|jgi:hypothetical protein|nr:MAG: hypothetical protein CISAcid_16100 [uncultured Acidilobus sp. CIS]
MAAPMATEKTALEAVITLAPLAVSADVAAYMVVLPSAKLTTPAATKRAAERGVILSPPAAGRKTANKGRPARSVASEMAEVVLRSPCSA